MVPTCCAVHTSTQADRLTKDVLRSATSEPRVRVGIVSTVMVTVAYAPGERDSLRQPYSAFADGGGISVR